MSFAEIDSPDHDKGKAGVQAGPHGINSGSAIGVLETVPGTPIQLAARSLAITHEHSFL